MNLEGFEIIHDSNLEKGKTYYYKSKFGSGYVIARKSDLRGWDVELQPDSSFKNALLKPMKVGDMMTVPPGVGTFYEPQI